MECFKARFLSKLKELDALCLPVGGYAIAGSGPLAIRNLRDSDDVDIVVCRELWKKLLVNYVPYDNDHMQIGRIEVWRDFINLTYKLEEIVRKAELIEGYPFVGLEDTISWKKYLGRDKDKEDVRLISLYLKNKK